MLEQELDMFLRKKDYQRLMLNVQEPRVYERKAEERCRVIIYYPEDVARQLSPERQANIIRQVRQYFYDIGQTRLDFLNLVETENPAGARAAFGIYDNVWFLDRQTGRVILYEGQEDFFGLRAPLEDLMYLRMGNPRAPESGVGKRRVAVSPCNTVLVTVNIVVFLLCGIRGTWFLLERAALGITEVLDGREYYRLVTYMFLHAGIDHLFNNMLILWFLGDNLEKQLGHIKYLILYFMSGILAGLASMSYNISISRYIVCVGASGAIFGVAGALAVIVLVNRGRVENLTTRQMLLFIALSLYGGFTSQGVDNAAHVGGLLAGVLLGLLLYRKKNAGVHLRRKRGKIES